MSQISWWWEDCLSATSLHSKKCRGLSEQADLSSTCPACRFLDFTLTNLSRFPPTIGFCGTDGNGGYRDNSMLTFSQCPETPRSKSKDTLNRKLKPNNAVDWTRNMGVTLGKRTSNLGQKKAFSCGLPTVFLSLRLGVGVLILFLDIWHIDHILLKIFPFRLYLTSRLFDHSLSVDFARWPSFVHHLNQGFSTGIDFALQGTPDNIWSQLWWSQMGMGGCSWHLVTRSKDVAKYPTMHRQLSTAKNSLFYNVNSVDIEKLWLNYFAVSHCLLLDPLFLTHTLSLGHLFHFH